ncbi:MAG: O-antigen ligase family protein [Acidobacteriota bacterium]
MTWRGHLTRPTWAPALGLCAAFVFFVPLSAVFHQSDITWGLRAFIVLLTGLSALAPTTGIVLLSILAPMMLVVASISGWVLSPAQLTDACMLAVVSGASLRLTARRGPPERLAGLAMAFGAAVLASTLVELHQLIVIAPQRPLWDEVWHHLTIDYWRAPREFPILHDSARWLAGLALAVYAERVLRASPRMAPSIIRLWILGGTAGALLTVVRLGEQVLSSGMSAGAAAAWILNGARLSALQPDPNAAGSYFALFLIPAAIIGWQRRNYWMLCISLPLLLLSCGLARSRAAIGAIMAVVSTRGIALARWPLAARLAIAAVVIPAGVSLAFLVATSRTHVGLGAAAEVRVQMTRVAWRTAETRPVFGVGLGNYIRRSRRFITPDMTLLESFAPNGENAHNNYLQILVELGIPAALLFVAMVGAVVRAGWTAPPFLRTPELEGMMLGLLAFLMSAIFGHPLLVPEVFGVFALALGLTAGLGPPPGPSSTWRRSVLPGIAAFYVVSVLWR